MLQDPHDATEELFAKFDHKRKKLMKPKSPFCFQGESVDYWIKDMEHLINKFPRYNMLKFSYLRDYILSQIFFLGRDMGDKRVVVAQLLENHITYKQLMPILQDNISMFTLNFQESNEEQKYFLHPNIPRFLSPLIAWSEKSQNLWQSALSYYKQNLASHSSSVQDIIYEYSPLCKCICTMLEENITQRSYLEIRCGCDVVVCTQHIACTCCVHGICLDQQCNSKKALVCEQCSIKCEVCSSSICHVTCGQTCHTCLKWVCNQCQTDCTFCDAVVLCKNCHVSNRCEACDKIICQKEKKNCRSCNKIICIARSYGCTKTCCFGCLQQETKIKTEKDFQVAHHSYEECTCFYRDKHVCDQICLHCNQCICKACNCICRHPKKRCIM